MSTFRQVYAKPRSSSPGNGLLSLCALLWTHRARPRAVPLSTNSISPSTPTSTLLPPYVAHLGNEGAAQGDTPPLDRRCSGELLWSSLTSGPRHHVLLLLATPRHLGRGASVMARLGLGRRARSQPGQSVSGDGLRGLAVQRRPRAARLGPAKRGAGPGSIRLLADLPVLNQSSAC